MTLFAFSGAQRAFAEEPAVGSYWEDAEQQKQFVVHGEHYVLRVATHPARLVSLEIDGKNVLGPAGGTPFAMINGKRFTPAPAGVTPKWNVHIGQKSQPAQSSAARMNVWRASPEYWEVRLRDIPLMSADDKQGDSPICGEIVFHAHPDRVHIELILGDVDRAKVASIGWIMDESIDATRGTVDKRSVIQIATNAAALGPQEGSIDGDAWQSPLDGRGSACWVIRPTTAAADYSELFREELSPLPPVAATIESVGVKYEPCSGLYRAVVPSNRAAFSFEQAWKNPNRRLEAPLRLANPGSVDRRITLLAETGLGNLPAAVITDQHGFPLPISVFVCKNFEGENEEPDDRAYGDIVFAVTVPASGALSAKVVGVFQQWGSHAVKQVSSIRFFNIYWHLSTGVSETTCFTHAWMWIRDALVGIPDFRPYSGPFLVGQPQHDCFTWPSFLQYRSAGQDVRPMYRGTVFRSVAPNLAEFEMRFVTSDNAANISVGVLEIPQRDESRTFLKLRYEWTKAVDIEGDARQQLRLLSVFEKYLPNQLLWLGRDGKPVVRAIEGKPAEIRGEPLSSEGAFFGAHEQRDDFSTLVLVRSFKAQLGGEVVDRPHLSASIGSENGSYWLGSGSQKLSIVAGDFVEAELMLMPHAEPVPTLHKPLREREYWATGRPPRVLDVKRGKKLDDFPARLRAESDAAIFSVEGGLDTVPIIVGGFSARAFPMLWRDGIWQNQQVHGGDGYQLDQAADGTFRFTFVYPIRGTERHNFIVSLMQCDGDLVSATDDNGWPTMRAAREAKFSTQSPAVWCPGENTFSAGDPLVGFVGRSDGVRALPMRLQVSKGKAVLITSKWSPAAFVGSVRGDAARLIVSGLAHDAEYQLRVGSDRRETLVTNGGGELVIDLPSGTHEVSITAR